MRISSNSWREYISKLSIINKKASGLMSDWMENNPGADTRALINYAYAISTKYGEAAAELACQMYDATAALSKVKVPPAEPAATATYDETATAVIGAGKQGRTLVPMAVERLVKLAGQDTTLQNAARDGAEWAWVPSGDTCAFCITLASNGWQRASKRTREGQHAKHIHSNCDCAFVIRFRTFDDLEGYDPESYYTRYKNADGNSPTDKINSMRRINYAKNRDKIRAQKRAAYARRKDMLNEAQD